MVDWWAHVVAALVTIYAVAAAWATVRLGGAENWQELALSTPNDVVRGVRIVARAGFCVGLGLAWPVIGTLYLVGRVARKLAI